MLTRRSLILSVAASAALPLIPSFAGQAEAASRGKSRLDQLVRLIDPVVDLYSPNTEESLKVRFYGPTGYSPDAVRRINWFMRDWRQKETQQFDIRVVWGLAALRHAGIKDGNAGLIRVNSGFRTKKTNSLLRGMGYGVADNSFHLKAKAADITMPGASVADIATYAKWLEIGGTGHYPGRFVHIDSGEQRQWTG
ncbi:YcbK family protein [Paracoccus litorisediminis]|uniref:YcbK family protein n=1 Tax=Paracoccus litorisediminis TaxID=2006130 RepID=UPI003731633B